jgi:hypothetical protein
MKKLTIKKLSLDAQRIRVLGHSLTGVAGAISGTHDCNYSQAPVCPQTGKCVTGTTPTAWGDCI